VPAIPPEIVLFPNWFWFNIYEISSWSRAILVPLSICYAKKTFKKISRRDGCGRTFRWRARQVAHALHWAEEVDFVAQFLFGAGPHYPWAERLYIRPLRSLALRQAEKWMLERFEMSDGLGAIYPSMMNAIIALRCLDIRWMIRSLFARWMSLKNLGSKRANVPHAALPVSGVGYGVSLFALGEAGVPATDPRLVKCADWMLQKQVRKPGDWKIKNPKGEPGGWYFEF